MYFPNKNLNQTRGTIAPLPYRWGASWLGKRYIKFMTMSLLRFFRFALVVVLLLFPFSSKATDVSGTIIGSFIVEGLIITNSLLASENPNEYGSLLALSIPILVANSDKMKSEEKAAWIIGGELLAYGNINIDEDKKSKKEIFQDNFIAWHLLVGVLVATWNYTEVPEENTSLNLRPSVGNGAELVFTYRF